MGIAPVRFTKTVGRHEITLKKNGYKTKTYSIYLENNKQDETYSFSALEKISSGSNNNNKDDDDDNNSGSGSTGTPPLPAGMVSFSVSPAEAKVSIDGKETDISEPVELDYGEHKVVISAEGYVTITEKIEIAAESADYSFTLEKSKEPDPGEDEDDKKPDDSEGDNNGGNGNQGGGEGDNNEGSGNPGGEGENNGGTGNPGGEGENNGGTGNPDDGTGSTGGGQPGTDTGNTDGTGEGNNDTDDGLTEETVVITKEAHPIRKWFSSLFKK